MLNQTPSAFRQLRAYGGNWRELAVRLVICAGEELRYAELTDWAETGVRLVNMYGITETTVHVTRCEVGAAELSGRRGRVIGGPLADLRMYVLDEAMQKARAKVTRLRMTQGLRTTAAQATARPSMVAFMATEIP